MKHTKLVVFIVIGLAAIAIALWQLLLFRASEGPEIPAPTKIQAPSETPQTTPSASQTSAATKITIEGDEFSFLPSSISVARGASVELTFKNVGGIPHNYIVTELGLATKTIGGGGKTDTIIFTAPDSAGTISYASFCSVPGHREAGMEGTIEIK